MIVSLRVIIIFKEGGVSQQINVTIRREGEDQNWRKKINIIRTWAKKGRSQKKNNR